MPLEDADVAHCFKLRGQPCASLPRVRGAVAWTGVSLGQMETKSWIVPSESRRNATMHVLKDQGYKAWHGDSKYEFSVEANEVDWNDIAKVLLAHAPGARINRP